MSRSNIQELSAGKYKRRIKRRIGLFIDGIGLDRATRRLEKKADLGRLVTGLLGGIQPEISRYYTLIPHEDDARQLAFLEAVEKAGLEVVVKRLPPKGVKRQVSMDVHIATDLMCYSIGYFGKKLQERLSAAESSSIISEGNALMETSSQITKEDNLALIPEAGTISTQGILINDGDVHRIATVVCPSRELSYAIYMSHQLKVETFLADFGLYGTSDGWKGVDRWIDLSTSETIWR